jgi:hypothetical protein
MSVRRTTTNFVKRDDILGQITPDPFVRKSWEAATPAGEWKPAAWLPVQFTKSDIHQGTDAYVISAGKVVAFDSTGRVVPAGLANMSGASALVYTATDVAYGVVDLTTGERVASAVTYSALQVGLALLARGLVLEQDVIAASGTVPPTTNTHGSEIISLFISDPIGVIIQDVLVWAGNPQDGDQFFTNYQKQHLVQFVTAAQMGLPQMVGAEATESIDASGLTTEVYNASTNNQVDANDYWSAANVCRIARYSGILTSASPVAAIGLDPLGTGAQVRIATNTDRTPISCDDAAVLVRERTSPANISKAGDWYLDGDAGVLFLHSTTFAYLVSLATSVDFTYSYYATAAATAHRYTHFCSWAQPGDYVTFDSQSNFKKGVVGTDKIIGRVLRVNRQPNSLLQNVKTAWNLSGAANTAKMPGSATKGFTDLITLSQESVADQVVIINVVVD